MTWAKRAGLTLKFVAVEDIVLFAVGAVRALQTANKEHSYAYRDQNGEDGTVFRKPMKQSMHTH